MISSFMQPLMKGGWSNGIVNEVTAIGASIVVRISDSLFVNRNNSWNFLYSTDLHITDVNASSGKLLICERDETNARVVVLNIDGSVEKVYQQSGLIASPENAILKDSEIWI